MYADGSNYFVFILMCYDKDSFPWCSQRGRAVKFFNYWKSYWFLFPVGQMFWGWWSWAKMDRLREKILLLVGFNFMFGVEILILGLKLSQRLPRNILWLAAQPKNILIFWGLQHVSGSQSWLAVYLASKRSWLLGYSYSSFINNYL